MSFFEKAQERQVILSIFVWFCKFRHQRIIRFKSLLSNVLLHIPNFPFCGRLNINSPRRTVRGDMIVYTFQVVLVTAFYETVDHHQHQNYRLESRPRLQHMCIFSIQNTCLTTFFVHRECFESDYFQTTISASERVVHLVSSAAKGTFCGLILRRKYLSKEVFSNDTKNCDFEMYALRCRL